MIVCGVLGIVLNPFDKIQEPVCVCVGGVRCGWLLLKKDNKIDKTDVNV